jgi:hypothetical protein
MSTAVDAATVGTSYEALRWQALGATADETPSHGMALFLLRGMSAWCAALTALGSPQPDSCLSVDHPGDRMPMPPSETRAALTAMLASMVLACLPTGGVAC